MRVHALVTVLVWGETQSLQLTTGQEADVPEDLEGYMNTYILDGRARLVESAPDPLAKVLKGTVGDVKERLAELEADELRRVLALERLGKNRRTLVAHLEGLVDAPSESSTG